jgi:hypothetical protein
MSLRITTAQPLLNADGAIYVGRFGSNVCTHCYGEIESVQGLSRLLWQHMTDGLTVCHGTPVEPLVSFRQQ